MLHSSSLKGGSSDPGFVNVKRFLAAVDELGFPRFELIDLEQVLQLVFH